MLLLAEEVLLLLLNEESGGLAYLPEGRLHLVLGGSTVMDLALDGRVDTDLESLTVIDGTPTGDSLLDPMLAEIVASADRGETRHTRFWLRQAAKRGEELLSEVTRRLIRAKIVESGGSGSISLTSNVSRSRRYTTEDGDVVNDVRLRVMREIFSDEIPDPRDLVIISLANSCGLFDRMLTRAELEQVRPRIDLLSGMDLIGRELAAAIRSLRESEGGPATAPRLREIPVVRGLPILGSALEFQRGSLDFLKAKYLEHGPVYKVRALHREFTVMAGPEANEFVARKGQIHLTTYWMWKDFVEESGARRDVISTDGAEHKRLRKALSWGYSKGLYERQIDTAISITRKALRGVESGKPVNCYRLFQRLVVEQIGMIAAGFRGTAYIDDLIDYLDIMLVTRISKMSPKFLHTRRFRKVSKRVEELFQEVFEARRNSPRTEMGRRGDLIDCILDLHRKDPQFLPESDLPLLFNAPFVAGLDTAAGTGAFMMYALVRNPDLLARVREETDQILEGEGLTGRALRQLDVTHRVALEVLRRYPMASMVVRTVANSFDFAGCRFPVGTNVIVGTGVTLQLPEFFPEPLKFDIDRYTKERAEHLQRYAYTPFGVGEHRCLGSGFAESLVALTIAVIVRESEPTLADPNYRLKTRELPTLRPDKKFRIRFLPRRS